eukprot:5415999-Amphidinium_carterae.1
MVRDVYYWRLKLGWQCDSKVDCVTVCVCAKQHMLSFQIELLNHNSQRLRCSRVAYMSATGSNFINEQRHAMIQWSAIKHLPKKQTW